jgi:hypothetical protein
MAFSGKPLCSFTVLGSWISILGWAFIFNLVKNKSEKRFHETTASLSAYQPSPFSLSHNPSGQGFPRLVVWWWKLNE